MAGKGNGPRAMCKTSAGFSSLSLRKFTSNCKCVIECACVRVCALV